MNQDIYTYLQQFQQVLQKQQETINALEEKVRLLTEELDELKAVPPLL